MNTQAGYVSGVLPAGGYLVSVPLLRLEVQVPAELVFLTEQVITVAHTPPADPVVTSTPRVPTLKSGQEIVVAFLDGDLNMAAIIAARPAEG